MGHFRTGFETQSAKVVYPPPPEGLKPRAVVSQPEMRCVWPQIRAGVLEKWAGRDQTGNSELATGPKQRKEP